jgi:hypothetical protein
MVTDSRLDPSVENGMLMAFLSGKMRACTWHTEWWCMNRNRNWPHQGALKLRMFDVPINPRSLKRRA